MASTPRSRRPLRVFGLASAIVAASFFGTALEAGAATGPFTKDQAEKGHVMFNNHCAECHRPNLTGALGPSLVNDAFKEKWSGKPVADLRDWIHTNMPQNAPGSLPDDQLDPIVAWILSKNGMEPGDKPLSKESASAHFAK